MKQTRHEIAKAILGHFKPELQSAYSAWAPVNIALCKYWGKRDKTLNLPMTDSLSVSLGKKGTSTTIRIDPKVTRDKVILNGVPVEPSSGFYQRVIEHVDLFRQVYGRQPFCIETTNTVSTSAGLASSASGFAALTRALSGIYGINPDAKSLSILARLGSGSACRSIFNGFVHWKKGELEDGSDSYAISLPYVWETLGIGILTISENKKPVSSREGMAHTCQTSPLFSAWVRQSEKDILKIDEALALHDIKLLGEIAERNAMGMHATMLASWPPLFYWTAESTKAVHSVWQLRRDGVNVYITMDAGPNIKLIYEQESEPVIAAMFPSIEMVKPFLST